MTTTRREVVEDAAVSGLDAGDDRILGSVVEVGVGIAVFDARGIETGEERARALGLRQTVLDARMYVVIDATVAVRVATATTAATATAAAALGVIRQMLTRVGGGRLRLASAASSGSLAIRELGGVTGSSRHARSFVVFTRLQAGRERRIRRRGVRSSRRPGARRSIGARLISTGGEQGRCDHAARHPATAQPRRCMDSSHHLLLSVCDHADWGRTVGSAPFAQTSSLYQARRLAFQTWKCKAPEILCIPCSCQRDKGVARHIRGAGLQLKAAGPRTKNGKIPANK